MNTDRTVQMGDDTWPGNGGGAVATSQSGRTDPWVGRVLLVSLLVMLNLPMTFTLITETDPYGFFTLKSVSAYPLPLVLSTGLSSALAFVGYAGYRWLRGRQRWFTGGHWSPITRGAVLCGPPVLLAYLPIIVLSSHGWKPTHLALGAVVAGALTVTHCLRDEEMHLDPVLARYWFICIIGSILVFLVLCIGAMIVLYKVEQFPASGNMLWTWEYRWSELGYPPEEYDTWHRDGLLAFTAIGVGFMVAALGGSMLASIIRWTRSPGPVTRTFGDDHRAKDGPPWVTRVASQLGALNSPSPGEPEYAAVLNGFEIDIVGSQYERLAARKEDLLNDVDLIVDKIAGDVFVQSVGTWTRLDFRVRDRSGSGGIRSGPFSLLCILARHPGRRFASAELRAILEPEFGDRDSFNVGDFIGQLQRRPHLRVERDDRGAFLHDAVRVCLLEHRRSPSDNSDPQANGEQLPPTPPVVQ